MRFEVWNWGSTCVLPFRGKGVELVQGDGIYTEDEEMAEHLGKFPYISVKRLTAYKDMPMKDLNKLAGKAGIYPFGLRKKELIAKLKEVERDG